MNKEEIIKLSEKVVSGLATENELLVYSRLCDSFETTNELIVDDELFGDKITLEKTIKKAIYEKAKIEPIHTKIKWLKWIAAASIILIISLISIYTLNSNNKKQQIANTKSKNKSLNKDILPGRIGAVLTLSNGQKILLDNQTNGSVAQQGKVSVIKKNGEVIYQNNGYNSDVVFNTMSTPKGRHFNLILSDGTKVWLNAASSITYPTTFSGKVRRVVLSGEAYFEVASDKSKPFKVTVNEKAEVEVLGTHFNINSYLDEPLVNTTLLEGSVRVTSLNVNQSKLILPGEQVQLKPNGYLLINRNVNLEKVMAWKNGIFFFDDTDLPTLLRQLSRWYDIDIVYQGDIPQRIFTGKIQKDLKLSQVLRILQTNNIHYKIENQKLIIMNQ